VPIAHVLGTLAAVVVVLGPAPAVSQQATMPRAIPAPVTPPQGYRTAVERGWRSADGSPGHSYWQQGTAYDIEARLDPETARLEGTVRIRYAHNAPITLNTVWLHLHQNFHGEGQLRNREGEVTGGVTLSRGPEPRGA
jgi:hypothetical protein